MANLTKDYLVSADDEFVRINFLITTGERNQFLQSCKRRDRTMSLILRDYVREVIALDKLAEAK